jgi:predicted protein tyrosine phosphatase
LNDIWPKPPPSTRASNANEPLELRLLAWAEGVVFALHKTVAQHEQSRRKAWKARRMGERQR